MFLFVMRASRDSAAAAGLRAIACLALLTLCAAGAQTRVSVQPYGSGSALRITIQVHSEAAAAQDAGAPPHSPLSTVVAAPAEHREGQGHLQVRHPVSGPPSREAGTRVSNGNLEATIAANGTVTLVRISDGALLTSLLAAETGPSRDCPNSAGYGRVGAVLRSWPDEQWFGMGEHYARHGDPLSFKGATLNFKSEQANTRLTIPHAVSSRRYSVFYDHPGWGGVAFGDDTTVWNATCAQQLDFIVTTYGTADAARPFAALMQSYYKMIGAPSRLPTWATGGMWASKERYASSTEIVGVARNYSQHGIVPSVFVIDWKHYDCAGDWGFTLKPETCWPDVPGMVDTLHSLGIQRVFASVHPWSEDGSLTYASLTAQHLCLQDSNRTMVPWGGWTLDTCSGGSHRPNCIYDPSNPAARAFLWARLKQSYFDHGVTNFWLDGTEPAGPPRGGLPAQAVFHNPRGGADIPAPAAFLLWPVWHASTVNDGARQAGSNDTWVLARSGYVGSHSKNVVIWSGDIRSDWPTLAIMVRMGINMQLAYPYWNTDTAGFASGNWQTMGELIVRWFQFSIFTSIVRLHGNREPKEPGWVPLSQTCDPTGCSGGPVEPWAYGPPSVDTLGGVRAALDLRTELLPYLESLLDDLVTDGQPLMRPLFYEFPDDPNAMAVGDQFFFGSTYLVAPVLSPLNETTSRTVYFPGPPDTVYIDFFSNATTHAGGSSVKVPLSPDLTRFPLFIRKPAAH